MNEMDMLTDQERREIEPSPCDWEGCGRPRCAAMQFCKEHGHAILLGQEGGGSE